MTIPLLPVVEDVPAPRAWGYNARIDDILVQLAVSENDPTAILTAEAAPPRVDTGEAAEDLQDESGFRYSRTRLDGGAGLDFLHDPGRPLGAATRFWDSRGVDVFSSDLGEVYEATLMHEMLVDTAVGAGDTSIRIAHVDGQIYYTVEPASAADELWKYGDSPAKYTFTDIVTSFFALGNSLYANDTTDGVLRFDPLVSFTPTVHDASSYERIYPAKGRVLGKGGVYPAGDTLWETGSTPISLLTLEDNEAIFDNGVVDAGNVIVVLTTTGTIFLLGLDPNLALVNTGQYKFIDEVPTQAVYTQGILGIATTSPNEAGGQVNRFYTATIAEDRSTLENVQLIYQLGDRATTGTGHPLFILGTRDSIYVGLTEPGGSSLSIWRYYLPTAGFARAHEITPGGGTPMNAIEIDDRMWVAHIGQGLVKEQDTFVTSGYVIGPAADFFTARAKQWVSGTLTITALPAGTEVNLFDSTNVDVLSDPDHADWELALKVQVAGETEVDIKDLTGRDGRYHAAQVEMLANADKTLSPGFRSYSFRAFPSSDRDTIVRLPVNVSDQFEAPGKRAMTRRGRGLVIENALRALEGRQVVCEIFATQILLRGILERVEEPIVVFPDRGSPLRVMFLTIRGEDIAGSSTGYGGTSSGASWGQDMFAIPQFAVGELS